MMSSKVPEILLVDHDDSFTYNLVHLIAAAGGQTVVRRAEEADPEFPCDGVVFGPGHGHPEAASALVGRFASVNPSRPILGVCLGHQAIAGWFGGRVLRSDHPTHGERVSISHDGAGVLRGLPYRFAVTRYNSLTVSERGLPPALEVIARSTASEVMALRHQELPIQGIQFHPESVLSEFGCQILKNWLEDM